MKLIVNILGQGLIKSKSYAGSKSPDTSLIFITICRVEKALLRHLHLHAGNSVFQLLREVEFLPLKNGRQRNQ